ncbi:MULTISPECIES: hypothetical protein [unclassified Xanthomonas]|uniref:hypothetical protein n=1 Tax=Xanthomonas sp. LMG 8992 TaxID=1591157 RepID=UPI0016209BFB|nr:hypothetical protein [Xanthomonas sp. LMG 8992]
MDASISEKNATAAIIHAAAAALEWDVGIGALSPRSALRVVPETIASGLKSLPHDSSRRAGQCCLL